VYRHFITCGSFWWWETQPFSGGFHALKWVKDVGNTKT